MEQPKSTFEDLEVWQMAREMRRKVSALTKTFAAEEKYRLADQLLDWMTK